MDGKTFSTKTFQEASSSSSLSQKEEGVSIDEEHQQMQSSTKSSKKKKESGGGGGDGGGDDDESETDSTDDENDWKENYLEIVFKWKTLSGNFYFRENGTGKNQYNWDKISTAEFQTITQGLILDDQGKPFGKKVKNY